MAIVDSVRDCLNSLELAFNKAKQDGIITSDIEFRPVACLKDSKTNLYEMFCLLPNGKRLTQIEKLEFRPTITGTTNVQLVRWHRDLKIYVKI